MEFAETLRKLRRKANITTYRLATDAVADYSYVNRLETGDRYNPSREMVLRLAQSLLDNSDRITLSDVNDLLKAAGHEQLRPRKNHITISELYR